MRPGRVAVWWVAAMAAPLVSCGDAGTAPASGDGDGGAAVDGGAATLSPLHVEGNRIVDAEGAPVRLRGVNIEDPVLLERQDLDGDGESDPHYDQVDGDFARVASWGANVVRLAAAPGFVEYFGESYFTDYYDWLVDLAQDHGLYAIAEYHGIGDPGGWYPSEYDGALPDLVVPLYDSDLDKAIAFWEVAAGRYGERDHVLFDIFNEPASEEREFGWADWRPFGEQLIAVVRERSNNLILGPGPYWTSDLSEVGEDPWDDSNVVYPVHMYPGSLWGGGADPREQWDERFGYLADDYPVMVTEWGFHDGGDSVTDGTREEFGEPLLDYLDEREMSWAAYIWHPFAEPPMLELDWETPTEFGQFVRARLAK